MRDITKVKKIQYLYEWSYEGALVKCYGCLQGKAGTENKHDLPPDGKKQVELIDNSDTQLLFNDLFMVKVKNKQYIDLDIADYGLFYNLCFMGFDDCCTDDDSNSSEEDEGSLNDFIVTDSAVIDLDNAVSDLDDGNGSDPDYELDEDTNEY